MGRLLIPVIAVILSTSYHRILCTRSPSRQQVTAILQRGREIKAESNGRGRDDNDQAQDTGSDFGYNLRDGVYSDAVKMARRMGFWTHLDGSRNYLERALALLLILLGLEGCGPKVESCSPCVTLTWDTSSSPNVLGYNIYRGGQSGGPYSKLNSFPVPEATYTDASVSAAREYYYVATAVSTAGLESEYSNEASVFVPAAVASSQLAFDRASVEFGDVVVGNATTQTVTITNTGIVSVSVSGEALTGASFSMTGLSTPLTLAGGESITLDLTFAPTATGWKTGTIMVISNASNSPTTLSVTGCGAAFPTGQP
jgi:hypothetical protein